MIVVCTGCSAKFRVADEKVGPRGAKLRCSKCQTVFTVQHELELPTAPALPPAMVSDPAPSPDTTSFAAGPVRATPPPLPRRANTTLDARAAFDVDLEPHLGPPPPPPVDPFASSPVDLPGAPVAAPADPFSAPPVAPPPVAEAFSAPPTAPSEDPFGEPVSAGPPRPQSSAPASQGEEPDFDPFGGPGPAAGVPAEPFGAPEPPAAGAPSGFGSLSLEEATTPPARRVARSSVPAPAPMPMLAASEDPFGASSSFDPGLSALDDGVLATAVPVPGSEPRHPVVAREEEPKFELDPFGAAAVAADPLAVDEPVRAAAPPPPAPPVETTDERRAADRAFRIRDVLVSAMALAALLVLALAILVVWRGGLSPADALRPSAIVAALTARPVAGALVARDVTSGLYERAHGAPLLFVRGTVVSTAPAIVDGVRVVVEVVRDGAVLVQGEVPVGAIPGPEALYGAADGAALARALAEAASPEGARLAPGGTVPFLVAFAEYPPNLEGASLRVRTVAGQAR